MRFNAVHKPREITRCALPSHIYTPTRILIPSSFSCSFLLALIPGTLANMSISRHKRDHSSSVQSMNLADKVAGEDRRRRRRQSFRVPSKYALCNRLGPSGGGKQTSVSQKKVILYDVSARGTSKFRREKKKRIRRLRKRRRNFVCRFCNCQTVRDAEEG